MSDIDQNKETKKSKLKDEILNKELNRNITGFEVFKLDALKNMMDLHVEDFEECWNKLKPEERVSYVTKSFIYKRCVLAALVEKSINSEISAESIKKLLEDEFKRSNL